MRAVPRSEDLIAVQRESTQVMAVLRKAILSIRLVESPSPVQGGLPKPPSPFGASGRGSLRVIRTPQLGLVPITVGAGKVTDRRNSRLACYFRHCG